MNKITSFVLGSCLLSALTSRLEAEVAYGYDAPGNLTTQSNVLAIGLPQFLQTGNQYVGVVSNGLVAISEPVAGVGPFTYQWLLNTAPVAGATNDSWVIASAGINSLGNYQLVAANSAGAVTSAVVSVSFFDASGSGLPLAWEQYYFGTNGLSAYADPDASGATLFQDYSQGYNPTNAGSAISSYVGPITWVNTNGGNWSVAANWSPQQVPNAANTVFITTSGNYNVNLDVDTAVAGFTVGAGSGVGTPSFFSGSHNLVINGPIQVNSQGQFNVNGGTLGGSPQIQVNAQGQLNVTSGTLAGKPQIQVNAQGQLNVNNGTFDDLGQIQVNALGQFNFNGNMLGGTNVITIGGTLNWTGGSQQLLAGTLTVTSNGVFNIVAGGAVADFSGLILTNFGTVNWSNATIYSYGPNNAQIYNYGLWNAQSDDTFHGGYNGGTTHFDNSGTFLKSGSSGTTTFDDAVVFNNPGTVSVQSGTVSLNGGGTGCGGTFATTNSGNISFATTPYNFTNTNTFIGPGDYVVGAANFGGTIFGTLNWSGGSHVFLVGSLTVASNSVFNIVAGGGEADFNGLALTNYGTVNWTNTTLYSENGGNAQIYNYGLWNAHSDTAFWGGFNGGTTLFDNFGTFLKSGNSGATTLDGNVVFNNTGTVSVQMGTLSLNGGGVNSGDGTFITANGGLLDLNNMTFASGTAISSSTTVALGGSTTINGVLAAANLQLVGGTLAGTNVIVGTLTWSGGNLSGVLTLASNSVLNIATGSGNGIKGLVLTNFGTVNWSNATIYSYGPNNAQIYNYGLWNAQSDDIFHGGYSGGTTLFDNFGTFLKSGNSGTTTLDDAVVFNNPGTVNVQSGTLSLNGGGISSGGAFATTNSGNINFVTTPYNFTNTTTFAGTGSYVGGAANFGGTILGTLNWSGGSHLFLGGSLTVASNSVFNIVAGGGEADFNGLALTNYGTVNWTNATLYSENGGNAQIYNYGLWNAQSDDIFHGGYNGGTTLFDNFGIFLKSGNSGTTTLDGNVVFNNTGTVSVQMGTLSLNGGGVNSGGGTFITTNGGLLDLNNMTFANSAVISSGTTVALGGSTTINGVLAAANLQLVGGTLAGTNVIVGTLTWSGGSLAGVLTVASNSILNIATGGGNGLKELVLTNFGTVNWSNATIYSYGPNNAQIYNYGLWNAQSDSTFQGGYSGGTTLFDNFGVFLKSGNSGITVLDGNVVFNNPGKVSAEMGTLSLNGGGTSSGGDFATTNGGIINLVTTAYNFANITTFTGTGSYVGGGANFGGTILGPLNWSGGSLAGVLTVASNSILNIATGGGNGIKGLVLTNFGTVNWSNATIYSYGPNNAQIYNYGLWNAQSDSIFYGGYSGGTTLFDNFGAFLKSGNSGTTTLDGAVVFNNLGRLDSQQGNISLQGVYSLTNGTLNFGLASLANYGSISLAGAAPLSGTVSANLNNGFIPAAGNSFSVLSYGSQFGGFTNTLLPLGYGWTMNYGSTIYTITVANVLPPGSVTNLTARMQSGQTALQFSGAADASYTVLATTNLTVPQTNWIPLGQASQPSSGSFLYLDALSPTYPQRFYQIRSP